MRSKLGADPDLGVGEPLAGIAREILTLARDALDDRSRTDAVAVHEYRKDMKRWRALLRLLAPFVGAEGDQLRAEAGDLARRLAPARDVQAALDAVSDLAKTDSALSPAAVATLSARIQALKLSAEEAALSETVRSQLRAAVITASLAVEHWPLDRIDFPRLARELETGYRRARKGVPADWLQATGEELHDLRKRVVAHRYQLELIEPLWPRMIKLWIAETQRLRERLGAHHDLAVLSALTAPHQQLARWRSRLAPLIAARQAAHRAAAARLAGRLFAERPRAFRARLEALHLSGNQKSEIRNQKSEITKLET